jgi:DNA-binding response OmpR family regulator
VGRLIGSGPSDQPQVAQDIPMDLKEHLPLKNQPAVVIMVLQEPLRQSLTELLLENGFVPRVAANPQEVIQLLRKKKCATVFVDCEALKLYSPGTCAKFKVACQYCRVILLCDKSQETHGQIIKDAMEIGIYACLLPPYQDWEVLTMVSYYPRRRNLS